MTYEALGKQTHPSTQLVLGLIVHCRVDDFESINLNRLSSVLIALHLLLQEFQRRPSLLYLRRAAL